MQSQRTLSPAEEEVRDDFGVLNLLLTSYQPGLWSVDEVARAIGNPLAVTDAVMRLESDGLIHRQGDFVFPTRAAIRFNEIQM
jgi:hypothetical protein